MLSSLEDLATRFREMRARRGWLLAAGWLAAAAAQSTENRGYLFVSNRLDEVLLAAAQLKRVDPRANSTLVADAATLGELRARPRRHARQERHLRRERRVGRERIPVSAIGAAHRVHGREAAVAEPVVQLVRDAAEAEEEERLRRVRDDLRRDVEVELRVGEPEADEGEEGAAGGVNIGDSRERQAIASPLIIRGIVI